MDIIAYTQAFMDLEREHDLFRQPDWDPVRYDLFYRAYRAMTGAPSVIPPPPGQTLRQRVGRLQRQGLRMRLMQRLARHRREVLVIQAGRQTIGDHRTDPALEGLLRLMPGRYHVIDTVPRYYHLPEVGRLVLTPLSDPVASMAQSLARLAQGTVAADDLHRLAQEQMAVFHLRHQGYLRLLRRAAPRLVLAVQNGSEKPLFKAARTLGIPVVEAQHGLIGFGHPAYSYAPDIDYRGVDTLPNIFTTYSDHWSRSCHYPVNEVIPLGNDFMIPRGPAAPAADGEVMVISANIYHTALSAWLRTAAQALPGRRFVYKLHPNQGPDLAQIQQELADLPNVRVVDGQVKASDLLASTAHLVVVQSTVLYEALQAGIPASIVPIQNYQISQDTFDLPGVEVVETPQHLARRLGQDAPPPAPTQFFAPLDAPAAHALLERLLRR